MESEQIHSPDMEVQESISQSQQPDSQMTDTGQSCPAEQQNAVETDTRRSTPEMNVEELEEMPSPDTMGNVEKCAATEDAETAAGNDAGSGDALQSILENDVGEEKDKMAKKQGEEPSEDSNGSFASARDESAPESLMDIEGEESRHMSVQSADGTDLRVEQEKSTTELMDVSDPLQVNSSELETNLGEKEVREATTETNAEEAKKTVETEKEPATTEDTEADEDASGDRNENDCVQGADRDSVEFNALEPDIEVLENEDGELEKDDVDVQVISSQSSQSQGSSIVGPILEDGEDLSKSAEPQILESNEHCEEPDFDYDSDCVVPSCEVEIIQETSLGRSQRRAAQKAEDKIRTLALGEGTEEDARSDSPSDKLSIGKKCDQCCEMKQCPYQIFMHGLIRWLCSEECFRLFRARRPNAPSSPKQVTERDKLVVSHLSNAGQSQCSMCLKAIVSKGQQLAWETMEFCNDICLGKYQAILGSHCSNCKSVVKKIGLGKYSVRFGNDVKQFCSSPCLEEFKRGLKVCSFCQKDISSSTDGFLAPVGDKGQFRDFCSKMCMEKYESMNNPQGKALVMRACAVCGQNRIVNVEVILEGKPNQYLCSEPCFAAFKFVNGFSANQCEMCKKYFSETSTEASNMFHSNKLYHFCSKTCMNVHMLSHRKIVACSWCMVKKYNFDMIEKVTDTGVVVLCSLNCLTLHSVSVNASTRSKIKCDHCAKMEQAQYHLTMSDSTIRNFCTYACVLSFQNRFIGSGVASQPFPTGEPKRILQQSQATNKAASEIRILPKSTAATTTNGTTFKPTVTIAEKTPQNAGKQVMVKEHFVTQLPAPKTARNVWTDCRPVTEDVGVNCNLIDEQGQAKQTIFIPVPVPVLVPVPVHMYSAPFPCPVPLPLPVPVPIFIPTTKNSAEVIAEDIKKIHSQFPSDPYEADLLMMAEMVADEKDKNDSSREATAPNFEYENSDVMSFVGVVDDNDMDVDLEAGVLDSLIETTASKLLPLTTTTDEKLENQEEEDGEFTTRSTRSSTSRKRTRTLTRRRLKKAKLAHDDDQDNVNNTASNSEDVNHESANVKPAENLLKNSYGVKSWKQWIVTKNAELEKLPNTTRKNKPFKTDLLLLTPEELNQSLVLFVQELRKPSGEKYAPDTMFYLCLGIQQYLYKNNRIDHIFSDAAYSGFAAVFDSVALTFHRDIDGGVITTRIEEAHLWESQQLGAVSPHTLLNTLVYFNTKYFLLTTVEEHMDLSFSHVMKHLQRPLLLNRGRSADNTKPVSRQIVLRYYPPSESGTREQKRLYEQFENLENPLRCPVRLYEFYLSKCPEVMKYRNDRYYLAPERSCVAESPVWYSTTPISRDTLEKMLNRFMLVKEINDALMGGSS